MAREVEVDILEAMKGAKVKVSVRSDGTCQLKDPLSQAVYAHARKLAAEEEKAEEEKAEGPYFADGDHVSIAIGEGRRRVESHCGPDEAKRVADVYNSAHAAWLAQEPPKPWSAHADVYAGRGFYVEHWGKRIPNLHFALVMDAQKYINDRNAAFAEGWQRKGGGA